MAELCSPKGLVVDEQKTVVDRAHRLRLQAWILLVVQCDGLLEFWSYTRGINNRLHAFRAHRGKFKYLDGGEWVDKHDRTLCRLHEIRNQH